MTDYTAKDAVQDRLIMVIAPVDADPAAVWRYAFDATFESDFLLWEAQIWADGDMNELGI